MKYNLDDVFIFGVIVTEGSLKNASLKLGIPISTISRRLKELEININRKLLHRNNKRISLTPLGEKIFSDCYQSLDLISRRITYCIDLEHEISGKISISAPQGLYGELFYKKLIEFQNNFPEVTLDIELTAKPISEDKDIIICSDTQSYPYKDFIVKKINSVELLLCAPAKLYLSTKLSCPEDILKYKTVSYSLYDKWSFWCENRNDSKEVVPKSCFYVNSFELARKMVLDGYGLALLPVPLVKKDLRESTLIHCLPDWKSSRINYYLLYPSKNIIPYRVQMLIRWLTIQI